MEEWVVDSWKEVWLLWPALGLKSWAMEQKCFLDHQGIAISKTYLYLIRNQSHDSCCR
jgi:hypothetical protein